jgi:hypothetical protein
MTEQTIDVNELRDIPKDSKPYVEVTVGVKNIQSGHGRRHVYQLRLLDDEARQRLHHFITAMADEYRDYGRQIPGEDSK